MRVALLAHQARSGDAIGNQLAGKVRFLHARGWEARLYVESAAELHPELQPFAVQHDARSLWMDPVDRAYIESCGLVLAEYGDYYSLLDLLPVLADAGPRIIVDYHGVTPPGLWPALQRRRLEAAERHRGLVACADAVLTKSTFTARELQEAIGLPTERIHHLPCFVEGPGQANDAAGKSVRRELNLDGCRVLLYVGRLAANKRVPLLADALHELAGEFPPVHAVVVGDTEDVYAEQTAACLQRARELGVVDRFHLLGRVDDATLKAWYRAADALVIPSLHEGFCVPVVEAMAAELPVVAARAGALPETIGSAGLTFQPDDAADLACQLRRVFRSASAVVRPSGPAGNLAIVAPRFGTDFVGGAETSLRTMAEALLHSGWRVEVFTTCNRHDSNWHNELPAGTIQEGGLVVHRYPVDTIARERHLASLQALRRQSPRPTADAEKLYLDHSLHSSELLAALQGRAAEFAAIVAGPYLYRLTWEVARSLREHVLLLPCFHDEYLARLSAFRETYSGVGGVLYHSQAEKTFAETELGINHPNAAVIGTFLAAVGHGDAQEGQARCGSSYVVYCGRYSPEKGVDRLVDYARQYAGKHRGRFRFVFMGQGGMTIPVAPEFIDLGFVSEAVKRGVIAGARALVQLSTNESLSLVALEAWGAGVPVIGHRDCAVLRDHIQRTGGGGAVGSQEEFSRLLDDLWCRPDVWRQAGQNGLEFVRREYGSREAFAARINTAAANLDRPLRDLLREQGRARAAAFNYRSWADRLANIIGEVMAQERENRVMQLEITTPTSRRAVSAEAGTILVPVRVHNRGTIPAVSRGPARCSVGCMVRGPLKTRRSRVTLPALLSPGKAQVVAVPVKVPCRAGSYEVQFWAGREAPAAGAAGCCRMELAVEDRTRDEPDVADGVANDLLAEAGRAVAAAHRLRQLPDDYEDVSHGLLASWKRRIKRKLLNNFRTAYVDVLSQQQSDFNAEVVTALCQLADCCAALDQAARGRTPRSIRWMFRRSLGVVARRQAQLDRRLAAVEEKLTALIEASELPPSMA